MDLERLALLRSSVVVEVTLLLRNIIIRLLHTRSHFLKQMMACPFEVCYLCVSIFVLCLQMLQNVLALPLIIAKPK